MRCAPGLSVVGRDVSRCHPISRQGACGFHCGPDELVHVIYRSTESFRCSVVEIDVALAGGCGMDKEASTGRGHFPRPDQSLGGQKTTGTACFAGTV
jgi:hypothetical protein